MVNTLANYLGTGSNPNLSLVLSQNGAKWNSFTIGYRAVGNVPWSSDSSVQWSAWNVVDENQSYYGTITLNSDGNTTTWVGYAAGKEGYYLDGIAFAPVAGQNGAYQLTVAKVIQPASSGPFPNTPLATPATYPGTSTPIWLRVQGDQIVNDKGAKILLKGVVRPSLEWAAQGQFLSASDIALMRGWGANVIRLDLNQQLWAASADRTIAGSYQQIVDAIIYNAIHNGMAVILDLHWTTTAGKQTPMADLNSPQFWTQVATLYGSFGTVLFELFNEPYSISQAVWLAGDGANYSGYQQLYDAVRQTGAQNICIVGGLDYAYELDFVSTSFCVKGTNVVYNSHPYNAKGQPGYQGAGGTFADNFAGILGTFPLIFTEFGGNESNTYNDAALYQSIVGYANGNGVHYTAFAWWVEPSNPEFPVLIADWNGTPIYGGVVVHGDLASNPPSSLSAGA
jgi:endoglucanase